MMNFKRTILVVFGFSNVSALMYQVVWGRELGYIFGTSIYAVSTVLTSFMAGLALGSYFFGRIADNHQSPVKLFSYLEIAIGMYGIAIIALFNIIPYFYLFLYNLFSWNQQIFLLTLFFLSFLSLIIPTTLMGGTFPVISKIYNSEIKRIGNDIGIVYSADTIGACIGVIAGGFILLPLIGLGKTILIAATINILIGLYIFIRTRPKLDTHEVGREGGRYVKS